MESNDHTLQEALRIAQSPAGQQLIRMLQQNGGTELHSAIEKVAAGDYAQAKKTITSLLENPEIKNMLQQLGR